MKKACCAAFAVLSILGWAPVSESATLALTHAAVIDGTGAAAQGDMTVLIRDGRIVEIGASASVTVPATARVVDARGLFLIPGLWDTHVHTALGTGPDWAEICSLLFLANGITSVRDMGGEVAALRRYENEALGGNMPLVRVVPVGPLLDGPGDPFPGILHVESEAAARQAVESLEKEGFSTVKILSSLHKDAFLAIADECRTREMDLIGHVPESVTVVEASDAGMREMEHLFGFLIACSSKERELRDKRADAIARGDARAYAWVRREILDTYSAEKADALCALLKKNGTRQCPTLAFLRAQVPLDPRCSLDDPRMAYIPRSLRTAWRPDEILKQVPPEEHPDIQRAFQIDLDLVGRMHRAGVAVLAGTDTDGQTPFLFPGFSLHEELELLVECGMSPMDALRAATQKAAECVGIEDSCGTIEKGKTADLVLLSANPLEDIRNTQRIAGVILNGRWHSPDDLKRLLDRAARVAVGPAP